MLEVLYDYVFASLQQQSGNFSTGLIQYIGIKDLAEVGFDATDKDQRERLHQALLDRLDRCSGSIADINYDITLGLAAPDENSLPDSIKLVFRPYIQIPHLQGCGALKIDLPSGHTLN